MSCTSLESGIRYLAQSLLAAILLFAAGQAASQPEQSQAELSEQQPQGVQELIQATPQTLAEMQQQAAEDLAAVRSLMKSVAAEQASADAVSQPDRQSVKPSVPQHAVEPRSQEDSFASILPVAEVSAANQAFSSLSRQAATVQMPEQLLPAVDSFVKQYPSHRDGRLLLARLQMLSAQTDAVIDVVTPLLTPMYRQSHPDWQPWFWAGTAHLASGNVLLARDHLEVALSKQGKQAEIWIQLAVVQQEMDNHTGALQYLNVAAQLDPDMADVYLNRAYSLEHLGQYPEALLAYQRFMVARSPTARTIKPAVMRRIAALTQLAR